MSGAGGQNEWITAEDLYGEEWAEWIRLTPQERWLETERLWTTFVALGGSLGAEPDPQSPFYAAFDDLRADVIAVPPFEAAYLERGHAIHFRCAHPDAAGMRIDVMSRMRGVDSFDVSWERRTTLTLPDLGDVDVFALPDLVPAKKTQ